MLVLLLTGAILIHEKVVGSPILLSNLILVKLVLTISLLVFQKVLGLRCSCEYACCIELGFIIFRDINDDIDLPLVVSIDSNWLMLHVSFIFNKASFGSHSASCTSLLAFYLSHLLRFSIMNLVYISVKYIVLEYLLLIFLNYILIVRRRKLLEIGYVLKVFGFCTDLCRAAIHKACNIAPTVKY